MASQHLKTPVSCRWTLAGRVQQIHPRTTTHLHIWQCVHFVGFYYITIPHSVLLGIRNFLNKVCTWNQNIHLVFNSSVFLENLDVYEIMWKKNYRAGQATEGNTAQAHCMLDNEGHAHTHTQSQYAILIAFPQQQWLQERASMLRCAFIACLV